MFSKALNLKWLELDLEDQPRLRDIVKNARRLRRLVTYHPLGFGDVKDLTNWLWYVNDGPDHLEIYDLGHSRAYGNVHSTEKTQSIWTGRTRIDVFSHQQ